MFLSAEQYPTKSDVSAAYPSATKIQAVDGGWMVFETASDYATWRKQA